jgi:hypothetical protein
VVTSAAIITPRPVSAIGPVDLAAIPAERSIDELPAGSLDLVGALEIAGRGIAGFIRQGKEDSVARDRGVLAGIALRAPCAEKAGALLAPIDLESMERRGGTTQRDTSTKNDGADEATNARKTPPQRCIEQVEAIMPRRIRIRGFISVRLPLQWACLCRSQLAGLAFVVMAGGSVA